MKKKTLIIITICLIVALGISLSLYNRFANNNDTRITENIPAGSETGEGETAFEFTVIDTDNNETKFTVRTDKETVGEALLDTGLISGEPGPYGMYVKTVNGVTLDYDTHGKYWAFYINDEYATAGVDKTKIEKDTVYTFKAE